MRVASQYGSSRREQGIYLNPVPTSMSIPAGRMFSVLRDMLRGRTRRNPSQPLPVKKLQSGEYSPVHTDARVTWLGHSSVLLEIEGVVVLIDPVFSNRVSPLPFAGPTRFPWTQRILPADLPPVDILIISHDHYDHLDRAAVMQLQGSVRRIITTPGVDARLRKWGVPEEKITVLDWWQEDVDDTGLRFTAVPTRHFSGRFLNDRFSTLWAGFAIRGAGCNILFGSDSGYFPGFTEIGSRLGPFDLAMLECGQYNENWPHIHMMPEETAQAAIDLGARQLLPIHWAAFSLAPHDWDEPIRRLLHRAEQLGLDVTTPLIGEQIILNTALPTSRWWEEVEGNAATSEAENTPRK